MNAEEALKRMADGLDVYVRRMGVVYDFYKDGDGIAAEIVRGDGVLDKEFMSEDGVRSVLASGEEIVEDDFLYAIDIEKTAKSDVTMNVLMRKEFALAILSGEKKYEYRSFNKHYVQRFCEYDTDKSGNVTPTAMKRIDRIHFYPYNNKWFLDVKVGVYGLFKVDRELKKKHADLCDMKNGDFVFIFEITDVVDTNLD